MLRAPVLAACAVLCLAACRSATQLKATTTQQCVSSRAIARLNADIVALNRAYSKASINHATDRFLYDVTTAPITNLKRNRMIDHAVGALGGACEQCFQAVEAARAHPGAQGRCALLALGTARSGWKNQPSTGSE